MLNRRTVVRTIPSALVFAAAVIVPVALVSCTGGGAGGGAADHNLPGDWVGMRAFAPHRDVIRFDADGSFTAFDDYNCTTLDGENEIVSWSLSGSTLTLASNEESLDETVTWIDENTIRLTVPGIGDGLIYRKGHEPDGSIFDQDSASLTDETPAPGSLACGESRLYTFQPTDDTDYNIAWEDEGAGGHSADIVVTMYDEDGSILFEEKDSPSFETVSLSSGSTYSIVVDCNSLTHQGGYAITISGVPD
jgi:hypothetical protein